MGVVYRAYDPELDRRIALKLLRGESDGRGGSRQERLLREAQALARLQHPNVIAVYDVGTFGDDVFIAMELVEGKSLHKWLKAAPRSRDEILEAFLAAGEGLAAAHRAGLVHRDFKPDNVIVGDDGRVRVLDFGLARSALSGASERPSGGELPGPVEIPGEATVDLSPHSGPSDGTAAATSASPSRPPSTDSRRDRSSGRLLDAPLTRADSIVGTPRYMSPEQAVGFAVDPRADEFSFCVALYQALYGSHPFQRPRAAEAKTTEAEATGTTISMASPPGHVEGRDWRIQEAPEGSHVPRWLRQVLVKGLAQRPEDRFASMTELLAALRADPSIQRQRVWRWGGVAALVTGLAVAWTVAHREHVRVCEGAERELAGVWDDARRDQVRAAFHKSGLPYADVALATVERTLDGYARAWVAMHTGACEATHVRGVQSQELLDLRMACLADRSTQMKTLSELFASADVGVVEHAVQSVESLPPLEPCADTVALKAPIPPPRDPAAAARVTQLREQVARANALEAAAKFDDGLGIGRAALGEAESVGYAPAIAEAQYSLGVLLGDHGDFADAAHTLERAYVSALAGRDDEVAARAAWRLVIASGTRQAHYEEGERWADVAEALAGRLQRKDDILGVLYSSRASLREREGKYEDALADGKRALEIGLRALGPDHIDVAKMYCQLGAVHYDRAEYKDALEAYGKCLEIRTRSLGADHPDLIGARIGIADVYGDSGDHERALAEYQSALAAIQRARPQDPDIPMVRNNLGGELQQLGRPREAFEQYRLAFEDWQQRIGPGKETIIALSNMAEAKMAMDQPAEARRLYEQGLATCVSVLGAEHNTCARLMWGIGESDRLLGKPDEALDHFRRSLATAEKALGPKHPQLTGPLLGIGRVTLSRHDAAGAKAPLERGLAILGDDPGEGLTLPDLTFTLAQATWATGDKARAGELLAKAKDQYTAAGKPGARALADLTAWSAAHSALN
jgi:serine/threonine protein kinase/tetratricopeptide (TPR) repeat protein